MKAVITGDIIDSSKFGQEGRILILNKLNTTIQHLQDKYQCRYTLFRGDSIQGMLDQPEQALWHTIYLKAALKALKIQDRSRSSIADIRISIGIGEVYFLREKLEESDGEAFQYSGRELDKMKSSGRSLTIKTSDYEYDEEWNAILGLIDVILDKWSVSSAEVVKELLTEQNEKEVSKKLDISQPAVSLRKKHAGWDAIKATLKLFEEMTSRKFNY